MDTPQPEVVPDEAAFSNLVPEVLANIGNDVLVPSSQDEVVPALRHSARDVWRPQKYSK